MFFTLGQTRKHQITSGLDIFITCYVISYAVIVPLSREKSCSAAGLCRRWSKAGGKNTFGRKDRRRYDALPFPFGQSMKLTFWGAAGDVTGSMHLVESAGKRYLLDCGLHQGRRKEPTPRTATSPSPPPPSTPWSSPTPTSTMRQPAHPRQERLLRPHLHHPGHVDLCN